MKSIRCVPLAVALAAAFASNSLIVPFMTHAQAPTAGQAPPAAEAAGRGRGARGGAPGGPRGAVGTTPAPTSPVSGNAVNGKKLYYDYSCYGCHGFNGETGTAFVGRWGNLQTEAGFTAFLRLRADRASVTPTTSMPNFPANTLTDVQAKDIYAYIRTFKSNSPEVKDIPTLNSIISAASRPYKP
jgi:mono/diheme cytochrome c family protein